jgi:diguanylate cyclase (GGDEF)-like protein
LIQEEMVQRIKNKRQSIKMALYYNISFTVVLFLLLAFTFFYRIYEYKQIVSELAEESIPSLASSSQTYSQVNGLIYLTERLINVSNQTNHKIVSEEFEQQISELLTHIDRGNIDDYLDRQLTVILAELKELTDLVQDKLKHRNKLDEAVDTSITIIDSLTARKTTVNKAEETELKVNNLFSKITSLVSRLEKSQNLSDVRSIEYAIQSNFRKLNTYGDYLTTDVKSVLKQINERILGFEGVIEQHIDYLRMSARVNGRSKFVRNIIFDFANQAEFEAVRKNEKVLKQTRTTAINISRQIVMIGALLGLVTLGIILNGIYLKRRLVNRLIQLDHAVNKKLYGDLNDIVISGDDEINDIAETFNIFSQTLELQKQSLQDLTMRDGLTGIPNRRAFDERFDNEWQAAIRNIHSISLLMVDIDYFKPYNDNYGHAEGDTCLVEVAKVLNKELSRQTDFFGRYGGEEFVLILPNTSSEGAMKLANKLIKALYNRRLPHEHSNCCDRVTISIGAATALPCRVDKDERATLLVNADKALYAAKLGGRNQAKLYAK